MEPGAELAVSASVAGLVAGRPFGLLPDGCVRASQPVTDHGKVRQREGRQASILHCRSLNTASTHDACAAVVFLLHRRVFVAKDRGAMRNGRGLPSDRGRQHTGLSHDQ